MSATLAPPALPIEVNPLVAQNERPFTVEEYHALGRAGVLGEDSRVELIAGRIVAMSPIGSRHLLTVNRLTDLFAERLYAVSPRVAHLSVQNPIRLGPHHEPEPDLVLLHPGLDRFPTPADAFLVVEVSDTTARYDREVKAPVYAAAGVPELWIVLLDENAVEVYRGPSASGYARMTRCERDDALTVTALPGLAPLAVREILGA